MKYPSLAALMKTLKASPRVRGIFTAGTTAVKVSRAADIDLVVVLDRNSEGIRSIFTMIEDRFSDIFFFDLEFIAKLAGKGEVVGNDFDGMFLTWLSKGKIEFDPDNILQALKNKIDANPPVQKVADADKRDLWVKTNYNFIANMRYFNSGDDLYHRSLEIRLLYSTMELFLAYHSFRGLPWRGEKAAVQYIERADPAWMSIFTEYTRSNGLAERMKHYGRLLDGIWFGEYQRWDKEFVVAASKDASYDEKLLGFWKELTGQ